MQIVMLFSKSGLCFITSLLFIVVSPFEHKRSFVENHNIAADTSRHKTVGRNVFSALLLPGRPVVVRPSHCGDRRGGQLADRPASRSSDDRLHS